MVASPRALAGHVSSETDAARRRVSGAPLIAGSAEARITILWWVGIHGTPGQLVDDETLRRAAGAMEQEMGSGGMGTRSLDDPD